MTFRTRFTKAVRMPSDSGEKLVDTYEMRIDERGHKVLQKSDIKENIYEMIQESLEESKIENIIRRAVYGDASALNVHNAQYFDATDAPTSLAEAQEMIINATSEFYKLPLEIREQFDHSPEKYVHMYGTQDWLDIIQPKQTTAEEVTNDGNAQSE